MNRTISALSLFLLTTSLSYAANEQPTAPKDGNNVCRPKDKKAEHACKDGFYRPLFDASMKKEMPRRFRTSRTKPKGQAVISQGFLNLKASASGQYTGKMLPNLLKTIPAETKDIMIVDLRQEPHAFADDVPFSLRNYMNDINTGKSATKSGLVQKNMLEELAKSGKKEIKIYRTLEERGPKKFEELVPEVVSMKRLESEETLVRRHGASYKRFYVTDHTRVSDGTVEKLVTLFQNKPESSWLHFHCLGGSGRATQVFIMYDIWKNSHEPFEVILQRHVAIGGKDYRVKVDINYIHYKTMRLRAPLLKRFYDYVKGGHTKTPWTQWIKRHGQLES